MDLTKPISTEQAKSYGLVTMQVLLEQGIIHGDISNTSILREFEVAITELMDATDPEKVEEEAYKLITR